MHHDGFAGFRWCDQQSSLPLANRRHQIDQTSGQIFGGAIAFLERQSLVGEKRREVLKQNFTFSALRGFKIHVLDLKEREVPLGVLRRANHPRDGIAGAQVKAPNLAGAHVDIIGPRQKRTVCGSQKAEAVLQNLQHAITPDVLTAFGVTL